MFHRSGAAPQEQAAHEEWADAADSDGSGLSVFEFLDDDGEPIVPAPPAAAGAPLPYAPPVADNAWAAMDADYRMPTGPPLLAGRGRPGPTPETLAARARLELPGLVVWLFASCLSPSVWGWVVLGLGLIAFATVLRRPFAFCGLDGQASVYRAAGLAQILLALSTVVDAGPFAPFLAMYSVAVVLAWIYVEGRLIFRLEQAEYRTRYRGIA